MLLSLPLLSQVDTSSIELFQTLETVEIGIDPGTSIAKKSVLHEELISEVELRKAACCDLSESFETNASISASYTDAVTGTRQIRLLGLEGPYALYTRGNLTTMGGLSSVLGLALIPGAWIQSIQLSKGPGSVVNGAGAISGQINYELRPSFTKDIGHFNLFAGPGRFEENFIYTWHHSKKWSSNLMVHGRQQVFRWDGNNDGYMDNPLSNHVFVQNAWKFNGAASEGQLGVKASHIRNIGGSSLYGKETLVPIWTHELTTQRYELWAKRGYFLNRGINRSIGTQLSANYQPLDANFGNLSYTGVERSMYGNLIFQDNLWDTRHTLKAGMDLSAVDLNQQFWNTNGSYSLVTSGAYGEYSFVTSPDGAGLSIIAGQRLDRLQSDLLEDGAKYMYVPRLHAKYNSGPWSWRAQLSRSYRVANLGAEYMGYMANHRHFTLPTMVVDGEDRVILPIESAWTQGLSGTWTQKVLYKDLELSADAFLTRFDRKMVLDLDESADSATFFYAQQPGNAPYSLSVQLGGQYEILHRTTLRLAYRYQDVRQADWGAAPTEDYLPLEEVLLTVPHLVYAGLSYTGQKGFDFELNATYNSSQRLPDVGYASQRSPAFTMLNTQITKEWEGYGQFYLGIQNLLGVRQLDPVVGGDLPFDGRFDASVVWGPIMGRQLYAGWRYDLSKE